MYHPHNNDADKYISYYTSQAGGDLPGYSGVSSQYGAGLGGIFRGLFRMAFPLLKKGLNIAAPHLKSAAKNIVSDVVTNVMTRVNKDQEGSGLMTMARRPMKRPPGKRGSDRPKKRRRILNKNEKSRTRRGIQARRVDSSKRRNRGGKDIF